MHEKLIPQLMAPEGSGTYDLLEVDFYWIGEFVGADWLVPLDDRIRRTPSIDLDFFFPDLLDKFAQIGGKTYMLPFWPYPHGIMYRTDVVNSPEFQKAYKDKFGRSWREPQSMEEYAKVVKLAQKVTPPDTYGAALQCARIDPVVMEWLDWLFSMGGDIYDRTTWECIINSKVGVKALELYKSLLKEASQPGALAADLMKRGTVFTQGKAVFTQGMIGEMVWFGDPERSEVADKAKVMPTPKSALMGAWLWAIPKSSPHQDAAWEFISWVESKEITYKRAMLGALPSHSWIYEDPDFLEKYPWQKRVPEAMKMQKPLPRLSRSTTVVEIIGENIDSYLAGEIPSAKEALDKTAKDLTELIQGDPMLKYLKME
jgi:ABC-type glycerol-3-phosphate transport system substrate-binding protein